jgi:hypothetical protein
MQAKFHGFVMLLWAALAPLPASASKCGFGVDVHFAAGSAVPSAADIESALHPVNVLAAKQSAVLAYIAVGHADASEAAGSDVQLLSLARVGAVVAQVLRLHPELKDVVYFEAHGAKEPISQDPRLNQRVEIEVVCSVTPPYFDKFGHPISEAQRPWPALAQPQAPARTRPHPTPIPRDTSPVG